MATKSFRNIPAAQFDASKLRFEPPKKTNSKKSLYTFIPMTYEGAPFAVQLGPELGTFHGLERWSQSDGKFVRVDSTDASWTLGEKYFNKWSGKAHCKLRLRDYEKEGTPGFEAFRAINAAVGAAAEALLNGSTADDNGTRVKLLDTSYPDSVPMEAQLELARKGLTTPLDVCTQLDDEGKPKYDPKVVIKVRYHVKDATGVVVEEKNAAKYSDDEKAKFRLDVSDSCAMVPMTSNEKVKQPLELLRSGATGYWMVKFSFGISQKGPALTLELHKAKVELRTHASQDADFICSNGFGTPPPAATVTNDAEFVTPNATTVGTKRARDDDDDGEAKVAKVQAN